MSGGAAIAVEWSSETVGANRDVVYIPPPSQEVLQDLGGCAACCGAAAPAWREAWAGAPG